MQFFMNARRQLSADDNIRKLTEAVATSGKRLPSAAVRYAVEKVPVVQWLPQYDVRWIISDLIAGLTIGVMMIPQALAYAKIATIPGDFGLYSSWLPAVIYIFMGTSKGKFND